MAQAMNMPEDFQSLISRLERNKAIHRTTKGLKLRADAIERLDSMHLAMIEHSLRQAQDLGAEDIFPKGAPKEAFSITSSAKSDNKLVNEVAKVYKLSAEKTGALRVVLSQTSVQFRWWGAELDLTDQAVSALLSILDPGMLIVLAAMFTSRTAGVLLLVLKGLGAGLKGQIEKVRSDSGVRITLYFYLYPVPEPRSRSVPK